MSRTQIPPPPTRFGAAGASLQPKRAASAPPPTKFGSAQASLQPKIRNAAVIQPMAVLAGAAAIGLAGAAVYKIGNYFNWGRGAPAGGGAVLGGGGGVVAPPLPVPVIAPVPVVVPPAPLIVPPVIVPPVVVPPPPYSGFNYTLSTVKTKLNQSEGRASPVTGQAGHPRQHAGTWNKVEYHALDQSKTKSVYKTTANQDTAVYDALRTAAGLAALQALDAAPAVATRRVFIADTSGIDVIVVKAKKKKGAPAGDVKSWQYIAGVATKVGIVLESRGTGTPGDIHIQSAYPIL